MSPDQVWDSTAQSPVDHNRPGYFNGHKIPAWVITHNLQNNFGAAPQGLSYNKPVKNDVVSSAPKTENFKMREDINAKFSLITSGSGNLNKTISLGEGGRIEKTSSGNMTKGRYETVTKPFKEFPDFLNSLKRNQAITLGTCSSKHKNIVVTDVLVENPDTEAVARTKEYFKFNNGPQLILLDVDSGIGIEELIKGLPATIPEITKSAVVVVPSSSADIYHGDKNLTPNAGYHFYIVVKDASDIERFKEAAFKRSWLNGYGDIIISRAGTLLVRTKLFDLYVFSPERLVFEAPPDLKGGLVSKKPAPGFKDGSLLDTTLCKNLTNAEEAEYNKLVAAAKVKAEPEAEKVRETYAKDRANEHKTLAYLKNKPKEDWTEEDFANFNAVLIVFQAALKMDLQNDFIVKFDTLGEVAVKDILASPEKYDQLTCYDPLEPDQGKCKAKFYANKSSDKPIIHSFLHGKAIYQLHGGEAAETSSPEELDARLERLLKWVADTDNPQNRWLDEIGDLDEANADIVATAVAAKSGVRKSVLNRQFRTHRARLDGEDDEDGNLTHHDMAQAYRKSIKHASPPGLVTVNGEFFIYKDNVWVKHHKGRLEGAVAEMFNHQKKCQRHPDYTGLLKHIYNLSEKDKFFNDVPAGIAIPKGFLNIKDDGTYTTVRHHHSHKTKYILKENPYSGEMNRVTIKLNAPLFDHFLETSVRDKSDPEGSKEREILLQEVAGGVITGYMVKIHKCVFIKGKGRNGKGVYCGILEHLIPEEYTTAVSPFDWAKEYSMNHLAGKTLNMVGELPGDKVLPASDFKSVTGGDRLTGRKIYGSIRDFYNTAAHIFSGNLWPITADHTRGFYSRWVLLDFTKHIEVQDRIIDLDKKIMDKEFSFVLRWALDGALRLIKRGRFSTGNNHNTQMQKWKNSVNNVNAFVNDRSVITQDKAGTVLGKEIYNRYDIWCDRCGYKAWGMNNFYAMLVDYNGVSKFEKGHQVAFQGIRLT